jgi:phosphonate transport system ATP-binding protein
VIISLHDIEIARKYAQRIIGMVGGEIIFDGSPQSLSEEKIMEILA